jgi:type II secretory pathway pseudopilin PulG
MRKTEDSEYFERRTLNIERSHSGFTSVELIIVMLVLGMLTASFVIKNPFTTGDYSTIAADQLIADLRYVQMRAMGRGTSQSISFRVDAGNYGLYDIPGERKKLPGNIIVTSTTFGNTLSFNSLGEPTGDGVVIVGGNQYIKVFGITGYVCKCKNSACNASECLN